jgi:dipeptidyl aminopeptidase/acylaminoacyl peptidase
VGPNNAFPPFGGPAFAPPGAVPAFAQPELASLPPLPPAQRLEPGVVVHKVSWPTNGIPRQVWIYLPDKPAKRLPMVLIAPAGSPLVTGMDLGDGDSVEHVPYVRAGFAVVAYSLDGAVPDFERLPPLAWADGVRKFMGADSGVQNARLALDYALARVAALDPARIYTAGHSSAATVSLLVAEREPRIKGCIAFAPVSDISQKEPNADLIRKLDQLVPGCAGYFFGAGSPSTSAATLTCPVFLFHAQDDSVVPITQSDAFAAQLRLTNQHVKYVRAQSGNHYNSMIQQGIPEAVRWLQRQAEK